MKRHQYEKIFDNSPNQWHHASVSFPVKGQKYFDEYKNYFVDKIIKRKIDGIYVNGIDLISWNEENKITEFKVIVRPLQAVNKLHQQMQNMLERMKA